MESKTIFATIGYIEKRKGQDVLMEAIEMLPEEAAMECEFWIVGQDSSVMAKELRNMTDDKPWIKITGVMDRIGIHDLLEKTDALICPSREDPMPTVCAEAMMHQVPCIVSDATGTASYITDGVNGFVFKCMDSTELKDKILWCIENRDSLGIIGEKAHGVFEEFFSEKSFEKNVLRHVEAMIGKALL